VSLTPENVAAEHITAEESTEEGRLCSKEEAGVKVVKKKRVELRTLSLVEADIAKSGATSREYLGADGNSRSGRGC
jgi:hypothetical protein